MQRDSVRSHVHKLNAIVILTASPGNPTLLGLLGFLIPYTSTIFTLCGFRGAVAPTTLIGLTGDYYFIGAIAMILAGIAEFILGNSALQPYPFQQSSQLTTTQHSPWPCSSSMEPTGAL